jgi:hypothetical protein
MIDDERQLRAASLREETMRVIAAENAERERSTAILNCDQCPKPKRELYQKLNLLNGVQLSLHTYRCESPGSECTAEVQSHFLSESPRVANRIVKSLVEQSDMKALCVSWVACLQMDADRFALTYPTPAEKIVVAAVATLPAAEFRRFDEPMSAS